MLAEALGGFIFICWALFAVSVWSCTRSVLAQLRFLTTVGQIIGTLTLALDRDPYILTGLAAEHTAEDYSNADSRFLTYLVFAIAMLVIELLLLLQGYSIFNAGKNSLHCCLHSAGCVALLGVAAGESHFGLFTPLFWTTNVPALLLEGASILEIVWLHSAVY
mmetsp:Transcript_46924/g.105157  ORF Transcript_46924/g.105157 Transcript_46924/m.105157 type:complete len:163 (+) Transcript_46924:95-583(+)|eukprot:5314941-Amphidinium_carterae.2